MVAGNVKDVEQFFDGAAEAVGGEVDFCVDAVADFRGAAEFVTVAAEAAVAAVRDEVGVIGQTVEAVAVAVEELAAE